MKLVIVWVALGFALTYCGASKTVNKRTRSHASSEDASKTIETLENLESSGIVERLPLTQNAPDGSKVRLLDSKALSAIYSRVFYKRENGQWTPYCWTYADHSYCESNIFTLAESEYMGTVDLERSTPQLGFKQQDLTMNYLKNLRYGLARECQHLVTNIEWQNPSNPKNRLIHRLTTPTIEDLDGFFRLLLGISGTNIKVDSGASQYVEAYKKTESLPDFNPQEAYIAICIAMASAPEIFIY